MVQVINTDRDKVAKISKKFAIVSTGLKIYFPRIRNVYFYREEVS